MTSKSQLLESLKSKGFSKEILTAFEKVARERFMPRELMHLAYKDNAQSIGHGQTISQPYTIAMMFSLMDLKPGQKVLETGSGSGYVLALLSEIVGFKGRVFGLEIIKELVGKSKKDLKDYKNIEVYHRDGNKGLKEKAPFDRILISAACEKAPKALLDQLKEGGILVAPIGPRYEQVLVAIQRKGKTFKVIRELPGFIFVPFV
jgi:protein-L-isoaspartate(D-aspartate) O-methyltransferase